MSDLKPCPFCGSSKVIIRNSKIFGVAIYCKECTADVWFVIVNNHPEAHRILTAKEKSVIAWNRRVTDDH